MVLPFFTAKQETPITLRHKAEDLLARSEDLSQSSAGHTASGENRLKRAGFEGDFRQFRDYRQGDRPKDIDWKRSARSDNTLVREREKNQQRALDVHIQNYAGMHYHSSSQWPTKYEMAGILGTAFALWANRNRDPVYLWNQKVAFDDVPSIILEQKSPPLPEWRNNSVTVLIGDYTQPLNELDAVLSSLNSAQVILLQVLDPAELDLPYHGRHIFEAYTIRAVVNNTDAIRSDYKSALNAHIDSLRNYCRKRGWHYDLVRTDTDMSTVFTNALASIGDER